MPLPGKLPEISGIGRSEPLSGEGVALFVQGKGYSVVDGQKAPIAPPNHLFAGNDCPARSTSPLTTSGERLHPFWSPGSHPHS